MGSGIKAKKQISNNEYIPGTLRLAPNRKFYSEGVEFEVTGTHYNGRIYFCDVKNLNTGISKQVNWDKLYAILEQIHRSTQGGAENFLKSTLQKTHRQNYFKYEIQKRVRESRISLCV